MKKLFVVFFLCVLLLPEDIAAVMNHPGTLSGDTIIKKRKYSTIRINIPPVIDGSLSDDCWKLGEYQSDYTQYIPVYKANPSVRTEIKVLYDDKNVYVGIRAYDDMTKVSKRIGRRDDFEGDILGVQFDSYFDHRTAFEFDLTAGGQKLDVLVGNDGWDVNWNAVWYGKVAYEDSAWTAEFQIPLSQLRYSDADEQVWGFNSWRYIHRLHEENHWNLVANDGTGLVYTFGELHGLKNLKKARRVELSPYVSGKYTTSKKQTGNPFATGGDFKPQIGLDAKIGITNNLTLDATINPDFGQVEADPSVMNLTAFETFFEEKRPFFLEGKNIFDFTFDNDLLFYTRRLGHAPSYNPGYDTVRMPENTTIGGAFKLSGKTSKGLSIGIIESVTSEEMAEIHHNNFDFRQVAEPLSNYFIGRFQKDYDKGNTIIGGILTHSYRIINKDYLNFLSRNALTYGLDFTRYWNDRKYFFELKTVGSSINGEREAITRLQASSARYYQRPDAENIFFDSTRTSLSGMGASFKIGKWSKGHWRYSEEINLRSPGLELNDLGYMTISNIIKNHTNISWVEKEKAWIFKYYNITLLQQNAWNANGNGLFSAVNISAGGEFLNSWFAQIDGQYKFRTIDERILRGGPAVKMPDLLELAYVLRTSSSKDLYFNVRGNYSKWSEGDSYSYTVNAQANYRPVSNLLFSLQSSFQKNVDDLQYLDRYSKTGNHNYLLGRIDNRNLGLTFRIDLAINPEFTLQYYGSPFVSIGKYTNFKKVIDPLVADYNKRFRILNPEVNGDNFNFVDAEAGFAHSITNPDFNFHQFRSNLVLRWEFRAGSALYLVWAQDRTAFEQTGPFDFGKGFHKMADLFPKNIFMIKFSYWLSR